jgi:hypothetical protein
MLPFAVLLIGSTIVAQLLQHTMPAFEVLHGARATLFPVLLAYGSLALPYPLVLTLAFCTGLLWDLLNLQVITSTATLLKSPGVEVVVGTSVVLYGLLGTLMHGFRPLFLRGHWEVHAMLSALATVAILLAEFFVLNLKRGGFEFPPLMWWRILAPGAMALLLAPFVYLVFTLIAYLLHYPVRENPREPGGLHGGI